MPLSSFHPAIQHWFTERLGEPSAPQREGWPLIRSGQHVLIAAPTGSGKTLAAFLSAVDALLSSDLSSDAEASTSVLYVSPLRALANDIQKNLLGPISEIRALDPTLPDIRVLVRSGDTPPHERARMANTPPQVLVTTPESLHILLTGRAHRRAPHDARVRQHAEDGGASVRPPGRSARPGQGHLPSREPDPSPWMAPLTLSRHD